ncbi:MAG: NAD+ kinase [bacterium]|nr:NAD+ kinase [bacterium]
MNIERIIIVTRQTRLEESIKRFNTQNQAKFFIEKRGHRFEDYELEYDNYQHAQDSIAQLLPSGVKHQFIDRTYLPNFLFTEKDIVITLGQDGLVVNTAKYLTGQPVVAVNPDPDRFDGILLPFLPEDIKSTLDNIDDDTYMVKKISMARVDLNDGQHLYAFNDFFIGAQSHISARYTLSYNNMEERQSSSGVLVSTPAGSTGWLSSVFNMAEGVSGFIHQKPPVKKKKTGKKNEEDMTDKIPEEESLQHTPDWEEQKLVFVVREPFKSKWSGTEIVAGELLAGDELLLRSHMGEQGVIFSDGMIDDFLQFNSGATATIKLAEKRTNLVISQE